MLFQSSDIDPPMGLSLRFSLEAWKVELPGVSCCLLHIARQVLPQRVFLIMRSFVPANLPLGVAFFLVGAVLIGSLASWVLVRAPLSPALHLMLVIPVSYVPAVLALLTTFVSGDKVERSNIRRRVLNWRVGLRWYAFALTAFSSLAVVSVVIGDVWGGGFPFNLGGFALFPLFLFTSLGEEIGWRGYALPLLQRRFRPLVAAVVLGVAWAAFHWVALAQNADNALAFVLIGSVQLISMSVVMTWVFNRTDGSIPVLVLMHAAFNLMATAVTPFAATTRSLFAFASVAVLLTMLAVLVVAKSGLDLGRQ
jgi:membrane protease YdiL (CAAX protease family)